MRKLILTGCCLTTLAAGTLFSLQLRQPTSAISMSRDEHNAHMAENLDRSVIQVDSTPLKLSHIVLDSTSGNQLDAQLSKKWSLVFFGFTNCPHVCPVTLSIIDRAYRLPDSPLAQADNQVVFISVDPERDSLEKVSNYLQNFNQNFIGYTGNQAAIEEVSNMLGAGFDQTVTDFDHSTTLFLVDPNKHLHALILRASNPLGLLRDYVDARNNIQITQSGIL